ncbi:flavin reductase family protein [Novosphingobium sp. FKTRR1]|uniref:flavin reductase family protein n=1 Tax=Novosphingobium sp. FKTRR1 TaxID=2879118 RepID=UPI001CEFED0B|nr:flavin reductase family protein [Novosphingobium sp. FKTRR1]
MEFDFAQLAPAERYKLMAAVIVPRPIAWITSQDATGRHNAAPFSFFNMMGADPPVVAIGIMRRPDGTPKDTAANIERTGEFVVNLVREADVAAMNFTAIDAPPGFDEIAGADLPVLPSSLVAPPRIASAPVAMECRLAHVHEIGATRIILGEVLRFHIDDAVLDPVRLRVDTPAMNLVGRVHGGGWYARLTDLFSVDRPAWARWRADHPDQAQGFD